MERTKKISALFVNNTMGAETSLRESTNPVLGVVIQDNFSSSENCEEFMQTITSHGIAFLRCANTPLPKPSTDDLSLLEKLATVLCGLWTSADKRRYSNDT